MKYEATELLYLFKNLLKGSAKFTVITYDPQFGDLNRGFEFEPVVEPYHWARVTAWFKNGNTETKQISIVPAKVLFDYLRLAISSAEYVEVYEEGEELTYVYGEQHKY
jgi:hypothetical protein